MASNLVVSEFLCFTLNKVCKSPAKNLKAVLLDFYNEDEIWSAKALLHGELSKLTSDELPRLVHGKGDSRARLDVDYLFTLLARADELNVCEGNRFPLHTIFLTKTKTSINWGTRRLPWQHWFLTNRATKTTFYQKRKGLCTSK